MKNFGGGGLQKIMQQANQMQMKMKKAQEELSTQEFEASSGGEAVRIKITGAMKITAITIKPEVLAAGDVEMLQDLVLTAVNEAIKTAKDTSEKEMSKITGGVGLPGMF